MAKAVGFTPDAGRRIAAAVRAVEGIDNTGRRLPRDIRAAAVAGFWARITGSAEIGTTGKFTYAWTEQQRTADGWQDKSGGRSGTTSAGFAVTGRDFVITGSNGPIVRMYPETDASGNPCYSFEIPVPPGTANYQGLFWVDGEWKAGHAQLHA